MDYTGMIRPGGWRIKQKMGPPGRRALHRPTSWRDPRCGSMTRRKGRACASKSGGRPTSRRGFSDGFLPSEATPLGAGAVSFVGGRQVPGLEGFELCGASSRKQADPQAVGARGINALGDALTAVGKDLQDRAG